MEMKQLMGFLLSLMFILSRISEVLAYSAQNFKAAKVSLLDSVHSDIPQEQKDAKFDRKQPSGDIGQDPFSDQWPSKCPRVDYALYGYNSLKGSPLSSGADPGFTLPIFNAEYKSGSETSGCRYTMPRGVVLAPDISCVASFRSEVIQTAYDLTRFMGRTARLDDVGWGPPFVASLSFQETVAELRQKVFIMSTASCSAYRVSLLQLEPPSFHSMFLEWILRLNNTSDENTYLEFLDTYGTHFVSQARLGASLTMVYKMENNIYMQHEEDEFTAAASYSSIALLGHTETLTSDQKKEADEFLNKVETIPIAVGVSPPSGANSMSWLTAVKADPIAINYDLTSIDVLFSERFMGGSSPLQSFSIDYLKVKNQIISIKERYCRFLKQRGELSDCEDPTPGFSLRSTRLVGDAELKAAVSTDRCMEECYRRPRCVALSFCHYCQSNESEPKFCQLFEENNIRSIANDSQWQTAILLNRIQTLLNFKNMRAITDLTSESHIVSTRYGCYTSCLAQDLCLAFTLYNSNGTTLKCTCHKGSLLSLNKEPRADMYFISPSAKSILRDGKNTSLAPSLFLNDWFMADCTSDNDCLQKNVLCFKDRCLCLPGFFFSTRDNTCIATCNTADLQNTFMEYPESGIRGHNILVLGGLTIETCKKLCITTNSCLTVDFRAKGGRCLLHDVTSLTAQVAWYPHTSRGWTHAQRTCMDSLDSYPGPQWYNSPCGSNVDCPDPNSWCLSGRCACAADFSLDINDMSCGLESCSDWQKTGVKSGVYSVITASISTKVWCDMDHGGGWLVFQRRRDGSVDFYRKWTDYEQGFGDVTGEFWLGLDKIHTLTQGRPHRLRVDLREVNGERHYAEYSSFSVGGPDTKYRLQVSGYSGDAGDSLKVHNSQGFTTHDQNNSNRTGANCAVRYHGAWWYKACYDSNLNGLYKFDGAVGDGIEWYYAHNDFRGFTFTEMKFKAM